MKRRRVLQTLAAWPAARLLKAQEPVVPPKPAPAAIEQIPVIESTIPDIAATTVPSYFTREQFLALRKLCDIVFPEMNGVPGAIAAGAPEFLDFLIGESPEDRQKLYREGLDELNRRANKRVHAPFAEAGETEAAEILAPLRQPWTAASEDDFTAFLRAAKDDIIDATRNSREWIHVMSKRVRRAGGVGMYWYPVE